MKLNGTGIFLIIAFCLTACGKTREAREQLTLAQSFYENKQFSAAKNAIDTLRLSYPREVEVLKEALVLMRLVERGESERNIAFCDSLMPIRMQEVEKLKKGFVYEKDSTYEEIGNYVWKQLTVERNIERSYIRCGVDEKGEIYLASIYFGRRPLNHTALRIGAPDGSYAETAAIPYDGGMNYRFKDEGSTTEVVTYKGENCLAAVRFLYAVADKVRIKAEYIGGTAFSLYLSENDKKIIRATYDLAVVLSDIEAMRRIKDKSEKKIAYIDSKIQ